jgi:ribosomal protein S4E
MTQADQPIQNGDHCMVVAGTHRGREGIVADYHLSKSGTATITVDEVGGQRFKTLARHVRLAPRPG